MKRVLVASAALALGIAGATYAQAGTADGQGAQKSPLSAVTVDPMGEQCESSEDVPTTSTNGFVILNAPGKVGETERVIGEVALKRGTPDSTFLVFLAQDGTCTLAGMLTTNNQGNGNAHIDQPSLAGAYYVVLQDTGMKERYASAPVTLQ